MANLHSLLPLHNAECEQLSTEVIYLVADMAGVSFDYNRTTDRHETHWLHQIARPHCRCHGCIAYETDQAFDDRDESDHEWNEWLEENTRYFTDCFREAEDAYAAKLCPQANPEEYNNNWPVHSWLWSRDFYRQFYESQRSFRRERTIARHARRERIMAVAKKRFPEGADSVSAHKAKRVTALKPSWQVMPNDPAADCTGRKTKVIPRQRSVDELKAAAHLKAELAYLNALVSM